MIEIKKKKIVFVANFKFCYYYNNNNKTLEEKDLSFNSF